MVSSLGCEIMKVRNDMQSMLLLVFIFKESRKYLHTCWYVHRIPLVAQFRRTAKARDGVHIFVVTEFFILTMCTYYLLIF